MNCHCNGTGKLRYEHAHRRDDGEVVGHTSGSHPCPCRSSLEPRDGEARWWSLETIHHEAVPIPIGNECAEIEVEAEVPYSAENFKVHRRGNRYYPTLVECELPSRVIVHAEDAREFARALMRAADAADAIDEPCEDDCGHWFPCSCDQRLLDGRDEWEASGGMPF